MPTFHFISLGCPKNRVDSEVVAADLLARGFVAQDEPQGADVIVVNTCAFIQPAVDEAIDTLLAAAELKKEGLVGRVVGLGCLPQRYGPELAQEMGEIDLFVTAKALDRAGREIAALLGPEPPERFADSRERFLYGSATARALTTPAGSAYVKIAEGCPNRCAYCTIPDIRGPQRSRPVQDIAAEVAALYQNGIREVNLVAQDLTAYGRDSGAKDRPGPASPGPGQGGGDRPG